MAETNYPIKTYEDALDMIEHFDSEIADELDGAGEASGMINDYSGGDEYHHENHVDRGYNLLEAATLLSQLSDHEETDSGLWDGLAPREAISAMAAYTYGNAVISDFVNLIDELNRDFDGIKVGKEGPKDWSPKGKRMTTLEYVRKFLKEKRA